VLAFGSPKIEESQVNGALFPKTNTLELFSSFMKWDDPDDEIDSS
jgi:hypothetical protein